MSRINTVALSLLLVVAACGGGDSEGTVTEVTNAAPASTAPAPTSTEAPAAPIDLAGVVMGLAPAGLAPVAGETGEVTVDILPAGSELRTLLEGFGAIGGHASVFAGDDGTTTVVAVAVEFETEDGAIDAFDRFDAIRGELGAAAGPAIVAVTGEPLLGTCASFDGLERDGTVLTALIDTSGCHELVNEPPVEEANCPETMAAGETAVATAIVPSDYEPFRYRTDPNEVFWIESHPIVLGEQTEAGEQVTIEISVADDFGGPDREVVLKAIMRTYSEIEAFGGVYRLSGNRVEAECTILVTAAS